ncbi:MAG: hypothetical protein J6D53_09360 [Blautia sp.]|nr:hypothetical protein [Blautia sp.]
MMEKLGKVVYPDLFKDYVKISVDRLLTKPLGTQVLVWIRYEYRPYRIVRWGKHRLKRLQWLAHLDTIPGNTDEYLPIRKNKYMKYRVEEKDWNRKRKKNATPGGSYASGREE